MRWLLVMALSACTVPGTGNVHPDDYAPAALEALGIHNAPTYVARVLQPQDSVPLMLAHPRRTQPAIRMIGEPVDVMWLAPMLPPDGARVTIDDAPVETPLARCNDDGICGTTITVPPLANGLHELCVDVAAASTCSTGAIAIVDGYHDPAMIVHVSDAHIGDGDALDVFGRVVDAINALGPDVVVFTGDAADHGQPEQRAAFFAQLERLDVPVYVVTGNHDYDDFGLDGYLMDAGPEIDVEAYYGDLRLLGISTGQDLDDGDNVGTISVSDGPDDSQLDWLEQTLSTAAPTIVFLHHPIYNGLFATVGPARDRLMSLVTRDFVRAVLAGHTHTNAVFDADGNDRDLSPDGESSVPAARWPLHFTAGRATRDRGGFAVFHVGRDHLDFQWRAL